MAQNKTLITAALIIGAGILLIPTLNNARFVGVDSVNGCEDGSDFSCSGSATLADKNLKSLNCSGSVKLTNVTVQNLAQVRGSLNATGGEFGELYVSGSASLSFTKVAQGTSFSGALSANHTTFQHIETCRACKLTLTDCTVASIKIKDNSSSDPSIAINLYGGVVEGTITFARKDGKVILHNNAQIKGNVDGGTIIKK